MSRVFRCSGYDLVKADVVRAEGCRLFDASGRAYVDFEAGVWCAVLGHNPPCLRDAIGAQLERIAHIGYRYTTETVESAAAELLDVLAIDGGKCLFLSSGSEAVEFAVQAARTASGRPMLLGLANVFLSSYASCSRRAGSAIPVPDAGRWGAAGAGSLCLSAQRPPRGTPLPRSIEPATLLATGYAGREVPRSGEIDPPCSALPRKAEVGGRLERMPRAWGRERLSPSQRPHDRRGSG